MSLVGVALIHLRDSGNKLHETPYIVLLYVGLMIGALLVAGVLLDADSRLRLAWIGAAMRAGMAIIGYVLCRTTGLPGAINDIGNWGEPRAWRRPLSKAVWSV